MKYKIYEKYKDSNEEWIGIVPDSWIVEPIREFYDYRTEKVSDKLYEPLSVTKQGVLPQLEHAAKTDNNDSRKKVKKGDFVINSRSDRKGSCGVSPYEGSVSLIYHVLSSKDPTINRYAHYLFRSVMFAEEFYKWGHGIVDDLWSTRWDEMKKIKIPMPPKEDREQISKYLDKKISNIDEQISTNKKLVELLEEKKITLINQLVTKGLNPYVSMKDSGIEWIGNIPETWNITKIKYICDTFGRIGFRGYNASDLVCEGEGAYTLGGKHIQNNKLDLSSPEYLSWEKYYESPEIMVNVGDLIITQRGTLGKTVLIDEDIGPATINPSMILIKNVQCNNKYLYYYLCSYYILETINFMNTQTAVPMISQEQANNFLVIKPPIEDQIIIANYLDNETNKLDESISKIKENIALLEEYKSSLIHHVVTGKIDVREEMI